MNLDTRHRSAIDEIVMGTEMANRVAVDWLESHPEVQGGVIIQCTAKVCSMQLARRIIYELLLQDDLAAQINVRVLN